MAKNDVEKSVWKMVQYMKDQVSATLVDAVRLKKIALVEPQDDLRKLIAVVSTSLEESYHNASKDFSRVLHRVLSELEEESTKKSKAGNKTKTK